MITFSRTSAATSVSPATRRLTLVMIAASKIRWSVERQALTLEAA
ncbi:hypothetical protein [Streptomyces sp. NPDC050534]